MERRPSDLENKLLLLYTLEKLGPVTANQLLAFMAENGLMEYIPLQLGLAELMEAEHVKPEPHAAGQLYKLTAKGRDSLALFEGRLPYSVVRQIEERLDPWKRRFRRERQMLADFDKLENGEYRVRLRLLEWGSETLDLAIIVATGRQAQQFCDAWIHKAGDVYAHIIHSLGGEDAEPAEENPRDA